MVQCDKKTDEQHGKDCVEEGFQLARAKFDRCGEGCLYRVGIGVGNVALLRLSRFKISSICLMAMW